jgi:acyl carrier protein
MNMTDDEILVSLRKILHESFEIDPGRVTADTHLFDELDLDSLDAVDLAISLQEITGKRIKPGDFKSVRTVGDVIGAVRLLLAA